MNFQAERKKTVKDALKNIVEKPMSAPARTLRSNFSFKDSENEDDNTPSIVESTLPFVEFKGKKILEKI